MKKIRNLLEWALIIVISLIIVFLAEWLSVMGFSVKFDELFINITCAIITWFEYLSLVVVIGCLVLANKFEVLDKNFNRIIFLFITLITMIYALQLMNTLLNGKDAM